MRVSLALAIVFIASCSVFCTQGIPSTIGQTTTLGPSFPSWRNSLGPPSQRGCFTVTYPSRVWRSAQCVTPPSYPLGSSSPSTVGGGYDEVAYSGSATLIGTSTGSFPNVVGLSSETDSDGSTYCGSPNGANCYSLQDNSNLFSTSTAYTGSRSATGWEQFVVSNTPFGGYIFIQYWLIGYNPPCPSTGPPSGSSWIYYAGSSNTAAGCYANSSGMPVPYEAASSLGNAVLKGYANSNSNDGINFCISGSCYSISTTDQVLNLYEYWRYSEFNIFGYCCGSQANFNSGTSITVTNTLTDQSANAITPSCVVKGYTAETNNLNLGSCSSAGGQTIFTENNGNFATLTTSTASGQGSVSPNCSSPTACQQLVGSSVSVTATPSTNWQFSSWTVSGASCIGGSSVNPCQFTMPNSAVTVSAAFTQLTFILITRADWGSGSVSPNCPSPSGCGENVGGSVTVTANANPGWVFGSWSTQTGVSCSSNPCSFSMPNSPVTLGVTFAQVTTISLALTSSSVTVGSSLALSGSISPNPGAVFVTIMVSGNSGATWTMLMSIMTNTLGSYSTGWVPPASGNYLLEAGWSGSSQFAGSQGSEESLTVTGSTPSTPTILFPAPATVQHGQTVTLSVDVFNPTSSPLNTNVNIQIVGPNNYVLFDVIQIKVGANSGSTGYYDWAVPTQTGTYTVTLNLVPPTRSGVDTETIQVT